MFLNFKCLESYIGEQNKGKILVSHWEYSKTDGLRLRVRIPQYMVALAFGVFFLQGEHLLYDLSSP